MAGARHRWRRAKADTGRWSDCLDWPRDGDRRFGSSARWLSVRLWRRTLQHFHISEATRLKALPAQLPGRF